MGAVTFQEVFRVDTVKNIGAAPQHRALSCPSYVCTCTEYLTSVVAAAWPRHGECVWPEGCVERKQGREIYGNAPPQQGQRHAPTGLDRWLKPRGGWICDRQKC